MWFPFPSCSLLFLDPSHERAGGNLRYFERLLEEEREKPSSNQTEAELATQEGIYERPVDYLPERDVYESLCRGEGVKLVSHVGGSGAQAVDLDFGSGQQIWVGCSSVCRSFFQHLPQFFVASAEADMWVFSEVKQEIVSPDAPDRVSSSKLLLSSPPDPNVPSLCLTHCCEENLGWMCLRPQGKSRLCSKDMVVARAWDPSASSRRLRCGAVSRPFPCLCLLGSHWLLHLERLFPCPSASDLFTFLWKGSGITLCHRTCGHEVFLGEKKYFVICGVSFHASQAEGLLFSSVVGQEGAAAGHRV